MLSRFLDWVFPSRVEKRRRKAAEEKARLDRVNAALRREEERRAERKLRENRMWNAARELNLPKPTRPAPPTPAVKPSRKYGESRGGEETVWPSPTGQFSEPFYDNDSAPKPEPEPFRGNGGTFDGGGASGDWQDDTSRSGTSCDAPSYSTSDSSSSSSSDSGPSSYDGGSSSNDSGSSCGGD